MSTILPKVSDANHWMKCHGSVQAQAQFPALPGEVSQSRLEGRACHEVAKKLLTAERHGWPLPVVTVTDPVPPAPPVVAADPVPPAPAPVPPVAAPATGAIPTTMADFMTSLTKYGPKDPSNKDECAAHVARVNEIVARHGLVSVGQLAKRLDLIPQVYADLVKELGQ